MEFQVLGGVFLVLGLGLMFLDGRQRRQRRSLQERIERTNYRLGRVEALRELSRWCAHEAGSLNDARSVEVLLAVVTKAGSMIEETAGEGEVS